MPQREVMSYTVDKEPPRISFVNEWKKMLEQKALEYKMS